MLKQIQVLNTKLRTIKNINKTHINLYQWLVLKLIDQFYTNNSKYIYTFDAKYIIAHKNIGNSPFRGNAP